MLRNASVRSGIRVSSFGMLALLLLTGCSNGGGGGGTNPPPAVSVGISPTTMSLNEGGTTSFTASVQHDSNSAGVTWSIGSGVGTLSAKSTTGVTYTAPAVVSAATTVTLTATSVTDTSKSASATITLNPPVTPPTITAVVASCVSTSVQTGQTSQCAATVTGTGAYSSTVTWSAGGVQGGNSTVGTISTAGLYTAPSAVPATNPVTVTATSSADGTKSGSTAITIGPVLTSIQVSPPYPSDAVGKTQQFKATGTYSDNSTKDLTATATWTSSNTATAAINSAGLASTIAGGTTTVTAVFGTVSGTTSLIVTAPSGIVSHAAAVTDSNGLATVVSNGLTIPIQLSDQDTGTPLTGAAVAVGSDPSIPGSAILLIADSSGVHPLQMVLLEGPPATASGARAATPPTTQRLRLSAVGPDQASQVSPTPIAASTGCATGSGTVASQAVPIQGLATVNSPISTASVQTQTIDALTAIETLDPKDIPAGYYGAVSVTQYPVTSQCVQDIINIGKEHLTPTNIILAVLSKTVFPEPVTQVFDIVDAVGTVLISPKLLNAANECWYSPSVAPLNNPVLNITSACFGASCILIPQLEYPPQAPSSAQIGVDYAMQATVVQPAKKSVETYIQSGDLGGIVVGTTDSTGNGSVEVPLGTNTVCVDSPGYLQYTDPNFLVSAGGSPLGVTLSPLGQAQTYTGTYSAPFSGTAVDPDGGVYSVVADFTFNLTLTEKADGSITGTASVPTALNLSVVSCPSGYTCSANSFSATATGSVTGSNGVISANLSSGGTYPLTINVTGNLTSNAVTLNGSFSETFKGTSTDAPPTYSTLSGTITGASLALQ